MSDGIKFTTISEAQSITNNLEDLNSFEKGEYYFCFANAIGHKVAFTYEELKESYYKLPLSILNDILTMSMHDEVVQAKITDWIRDEYLPKQIEN